MRGYMPQITRGEFISTNDGAGEQTVKAYGLAGETFTDVYRPQPFGLAGHVPSGGNGLLLALGGERSKAVMLGGEVPGKRPTGTPEGQTVLYDAEGNIIFLRGANGMKIKAKNNDVLIIPGPDNKKVYLGGDPADGGTFARVATESGYSNFVYAKV